MREVIGEGRIENHRTPRPRFGRGELHRAPRMSERLLGEVPGQLIFEYI